MATKALPSSNAAWQKHIRFAALQTANIVITSHVKDRMMSRNVLVTEIFDCLQNGTIVRPPRKHPASGNLVCRMECAINGRILAVAVDVESLFPSGLVTVTVFY